MKIKNKKEILNLGLFSIIFLIGIAASQLDYSTSYSNSYPDYYNRYDGGYNIYGSSINPQFNPPGYSGVSTQNYWSDYRNNNCIAGQDLVLIIPPGGCRPSVVRSDLLEEQNVPVFCKVMALQVNPLMDMSKIRSIRFRGQYPKGVSGVSYYPARTAVGGKSTFQNSDFDDNLGYLVVVLNQISNEKDMPDFVEGNITAVVDYVSEASFGLGDSQFYLKEVRNEEWLRDYKDYGFMNGRGYLRVEDVQNDRVSVSIYRDRDSKQSTMTLKKGETSGSVYLGGFYCAAGLNVRVDDIGYPVDSALLQINDEQKWVAKGDSIMNNRCRVVDLNINAPESSIKIQCPGSKLIELSLAPGKAIFTDDKKGLFTAGIGESVNEKIYLGYLGQDVDGKRYTVLINDGFSSSSIEFKGKNTYGIISGEVKDNMNIATIKERVEKALKNHYSSTLSLKEDEMKEKLKVEVVEENEEKLGVVLKEVYIAKDKVWDYASLSEQQKLAREYYDLSISEYEDLFNLYPGEKMEYVEEDEYAAKGLLEAAQMSRSFGMDSKSYDYYKKLSKEYPDSDSGKIGRILSRNLLKYDTSKSKASVNIMNEYYFVDFLDFKKPSTEEISAVLLIDGQEKIIGLNEVKTISKGDKTHNFKLTSIKDDYVDVEYGEKTEQVKQRKKLSLGKNEQGDFNGLDVKLLRINLNKQAKITVLSRGYGPITESTFNFKIGIEKRAIKLSPERAKEMIESIKKSLKSWADINEKLENVVKALKGACFATSAMLTTKNAINGNTGESIARVILMTGSGGWNEKCEEMVNNGRYSSVHECLLEHKGEVNGDINIYSGNINEVNKIVDGLKDKYRTGGGIFEEGNVDSKKVEEDFKNIFESWCKQNKDKIVLPGKDKAEIELGDSDKSVCNWESLSHEQRMEIMALHKTKGSGSESLRNLTSNRLGNTLLEAKNYHDEREDQIRSDNEANQNNLGIKTSEPAGDSVAQGFIKTISITDLDHNVYKNFKEGDKVVRVFIPQEKSFNGAVVFELNESVKREIGGRQVIVEVESSKNDNYFVPKPNGKVYRVDGVKISPESSEEVRRYMSLAGLNKIKNSDKESYENKMVNPERLRVKYFDKSPYKGMPAEIPFDIEDGWYVEMTYVLSGFGKPYDDSGRVINFYICNVGNNGIIEFKKSADDICRYYNSVNPDVSFPGLSEKESLVLVAKAKLAIQEAAKQYGKSRVTINGKTFESGTSFGGEEGRCTDFMSIEDCTLMFNVCDPVICPSSRCDYGGKYRVDDVIQSGIAGSLLLCLPNYKEGVMIPICLTGVHAGLEAYMSILNSTVDCLNESIETGRNLGICDEIKSVYLCEFFWRQAAPLTEILLPTFFEGSRGGGEYLNIQGSWDNTRSAINYFTGTYAQNSFRAFNTRMTDDAGLDISSEVCRSFASADISGVKRLFEGLIEPDSPVQYSAWFSEHPMSDATVPPTSQYKVYYHVYSGKDQGAYYTVYLKDVPELGYIHTSRYYVVDRGYINRRGQIDRTRDFIAVSGFKQLCVNINGKDECGFGKVSTSYALNSLTESFVAQQVESKITKEKKCVAGTPSFGSLIQPNIQAGVGEVINPQLYNQGIIRVCASENPGKEVLPSGEYDVSKSSFDKWQDVGYCDDPSIRCWLDTGSVKDAIKNKGLEEEALGNVEENYLEKNGYWTYEKSRSAGDMAQNFIEELKIVSGDNKESITNKIRAIVVDLKGMSQLGTTNVHRARAHYLLGNLYRKIAKELWSGKGGNGGSIIFDEKFISDQGYITDSIPDDLPAETTEIPEPIINPIAVNTPPKDTSKKTPVFYVLDNKIYDSNRKYTNLYLKPGRIDSGILYYVYEDGFLFFNSYKGFIDSEKKTFIFERSSNDLSSIDYDLSHPLHGLYFNPETKEFFRNPVNEGVSFVLQNGLIYKDGKMTGFQIIVLSTGIFIYERIGNVNNIAGKVDGREIKFEDSVKSRNPVASELESCCYFDKDSSLFVKKN